MGLSGFRSGIVFLAIFSAAVLASNASAAELELYKNDSVTIDGANSTVEWGQNYTFNATSFNLYNDTLEINRTGELENWNISISSNTTEEINSTLYKYNLTQTLDYGSTVLKVETSANSPTQVDYRFTGIPAISSDHYVLQRDGEQVSTFTSGGTISWSYSDWDSNHTFSVIFEEKAEEDTGDSNGDDDSGGGGSIDIGGGISISDRLTDSHGWSFVDSNRFSFDSIKESIGLETVTVETEENRSSFNIEVRRLKDVPSNLQLQDQYSLYSINTSAQDNEIQSTTIQFAVNRSFATQYDQVVLSRYQDSQWNDLSTRPVEQTGKEWLYEASASGFSYYTIKGENTETTNQSQEQDQTTEEPTQSEEQTQNQNQRIREQAESLVQQAQTEITEKEPGYQTLQRAEQELQSGNYQQAQSLAQQAIQQNRSQKDGGLPWILIAAGVTLTTVVVVAAGYLYYRKRKQSRLKQKLSQIRTPLKKKARDLELDNPEYVFQKLDEAEEHLDDNNYREAEQKIREIKDHLD
jgi:PGF-pre-PGF domain-containing protein